jgi:hypothetical protein
MLSKSLMIAGSAVLMLSALPASAQPNPPVNQQNPSTVDPKPCAPAILDVNRCSFLAALGGAGATY